VASTSDGFRTYRVSRIERATLVEQPVVRPTNFDLAEHWKSSSARFSETLPRYDARLRLEPRAAGWLKVWASAWPITDERPDPADPPGWVRVRVQVDGEDDACSIVLSLGPRADVIEPSSLRARVAAEAAAVAKRARAFTA
jgi:predicted DNA-binding transcriptional regulator YafY